MLLSLGHSVSQGPRFYMTGWPTDAQQPEFFENQIPDSYEAKKIVAEAHGAKGY